MFEPPADRAGLRGGKEPWQRDSRFAQGVIVAADRGVGGGAVEEHQHNRRRLLRIRPTEMRRVIYTPDAIETLNRQLQKAPKTKGHFPTEDAAKAAN